ncbi:MAG: DUF1080 domain-containing protein [Gemmataceae bacterium]|nr:DUF1080 domain-containing protein [Gemmataceae bacterium]
MNTLSKTLAVSFFSLGLAALAYAQERAEDSKAPVQRAIIDGQGAGWKNLEEDDFQNVNCDAETWTWKDGVIYCTGKPVGVTRTKKSFTNFEIVLHWRHMKSAGNSGVFLWASEEGLQGLKGGQLPKAGIEVQILDHGYAENFEKQNKKKPDWFTTNGDVFAVGKSKMKPFAPSSPNGSRSFPVKNLSKGVGIWNHYYIRAINGEVRLWVNGEEVSGGNNCTPKEGFICLESEGSPIEFKNIKVRELP